MNLAQNFLQELTHEAAVSRKLLERSPTEKFGWKPHEKSMSFGRLASHLAEIPGWTIMVIDKDLFEITGDMKPFEAKSTDEVVRLFDDQLAQAKNLLGKTNDTHLAKQWKMTANGNTMVDMPRAAVIRSWVLNHMIHHRGQLSVYLRENNIPVPAIYGPSADERG